MIQEYLFFLKKIPKLLTPPPFLFRYVSMIYFIIIFSLTFLGQVMAGPCSEMIEKSKVKNPEQMSYVKLIEESYPQEGSTYEAFLKYFSKDLKYSNTSERILYEQLLIDILKEGDDEGIFCKITPKGLDVLNFKEISSYIKNKKWNNARQESLDDNQRNLNYLRGQFEKNQIMGLEVVIAAAKKSFSSGFGHAMLRFVDQRDYFESHLILSFVGDINEKKLSLRKGLFGGYRVLPKIGEFKEMWDKYVFGEKRELKRYIIPTTQEERKALSEVLFQWIANPVKFKEYKFVENNCASLLSDLLKDSKIINKKVTSVVPIRFGNNLFKNKVALPRTTEIQTIENLFEKASIALGLSPSQAKNQKMAVAYLLISGNWKPNALSQLEKSLNSLEIKRLIKFLPEIPDHFHEEILEKYQIKSEKYADELPSIYTMEEFPAFVYQKFEDKVCAEKIAQFIENGKSPTYQFISEFTISPKTRDILEKIFHTFKNTPLPKDTVNKNCYRWDLLTFQKGKQVYPGLVIKLPENKKQIEDEIQIIKFKKLSPFLINHLKLMKTEVQIYEEKLDQINNLFSKIYEQEILKSMPSQGDIPTSLKIAQDFKEKINENFDSTQRDIISEVLLKIIGSVL